MSLRVPIYQEGSQPRAEDFDLDNLSLLVFGPGSGEAQVLIFPDGSLGVVDGCREPKDKSGRGDPVRVFIQDWFRIHPGRRLRFVALTHPHDDHYAGLGKLIEAHDPVIEELWRGPMTDQWCKAYIEHRRREDVNSDSVPTSGAMRNPKGLERVFAAYKERRAKTNVLGASKLMFSRRFGDHELSIVSVAPSLNDIDQTQHELLDRIYDHRPGGSARFDPNHTSAALVVEWHRSRILLGGDLLCKSKRLEGWSAASPLIPKRQFQVVKIAHHASGEAQDFELLGRLKPKLSIVTPFKHAGGNNPPRPEKIKNLLGISPVAITSPPQWSGADSGAIRADLPAPSAAAVPQRNSALGPIETSIQGSVCVSLNENGKITKLLLTGGARRYHIS